jgi:enoyl-[acyl-carrier protein] reductase II
LIAALALGAEGVEVGTRFVATKECPAPDFFKQSLLGAKGNQTILLGQGGMPSRVLKNRMTEALSNPDKSKNEGLINGGGYGYIQGDADTAVLPAGQVAGLISDIKGIRNIFPDMIAEAEKVAARLHAFFNRTVQDR